MLGQDQDIVAAVAQGRQIQRHHGEAVEQILAKFAGPHRLGEVAVGGRHDAGVHGNRLVAADAKDDFLLENTQQLGLAAGAEVADFIEKKRAAGGRLELAGARLARIGEGAFLMAE